MNAAVGDRIVIEIGKRQASTSVASGANNLRINTAGSDLPEDDTDTDTAKNSWIDFSSTIEFEPYYFASSPAVPPDNDATGVADAATSTLVPPTGMLAGDLVAVTGQVSNATTGNITVNNAGGQTWFGPYEHAANDQNLCVYWCQFNGTWSANPTFTCAALSGTQPYSVIMHVWRPPSQDWDWSLDVAFAGADQAAATTATITGQQTTGDNTVSLATWCTNDDNTWSNLVGSGWASIGPTQQRNLAGADQSMTWANKIITLANVDGADFDGTNDYMTRGAELTGAADSKSGIISLLLRLDGGDGGTQYLLDGVTTLGGATDRIRFFRNLSNQFRLIAQNAAGTQILDMATGAGNYTTRNGFMHVLLSWDLNASAGHLYVNDVSDRTTFTPTNDTIDYTLGDWGVGALADGTQKINGVLAELYFAPGQYLDFSVESNRRKFITERKMPVDLGATGAGPTGTAPLIYLSNRNGEAVANFATNKGTGGNFTITGTLDQVAGINTFGSAHTLAVSKDMAGVGTDAGVKGMVTWRAVPQTAPNKLISVNQAIKRASSY